MDAAVPGISETGITTGLSGIDEPLGPPAGGIETTEVLALLMEIAGVGIQTAEDEVGVLECDFPVAGFGDDVLDAGSMWAHPECALAVGAEAGLEFPEVVTEITFIKCIPGLSGIERMRLGAMSGNDARRWRFRMNDMAHGSGFLAAQFPEGFVLADGDVHQRQFRVGLAPFSFEDLAELNRAG